VKISVEALLLDMDGVLVASTATVEASWTAWAREHDIDPADVLAIAHGLPTRAVIGHFLPAGRVAAETDAFERAETGWGHDIAVPGAEAVLAQRVLPVAVATSATRALAERRLRNAGLPVPDVLVAADDVRRGKPDPEPYLLAARRLGAEPWRCAGVEDSRPGLAALAAARVVPIALSTTHRRADLLVSRPVAVLADLTALTLGERSVQWPDSGTLEGS